MQYHCLNFLYYTVFSLLVLHLSTFFSIFLVQRDFCLGQEASIGPVWSGVRAERLFVSNRTFRSIPAPVPNDTFSLVPPRPNVRPFGGLLLLVTCQISLCFFHMAILLYRAWKFKFKYDGKYTFPEQDKF